MRRNLKIDPDFMLIDDGRVQAAQDLYRGAAVVEVAAFAGPAD
jgi:hypothetical protein